MHLPLLTIPEAEKLDQGLPPDHSNAVSQVSVLWALAKLLDAFFRDKEKQLFECCKDGCASKRRAVGKLFVILIDLFERQAVLFQNLLREIGQEAILEFQSLDAQKLCDVAV